MKRIIKIASVVLCLSILGLAFAACGASEPEKKDAVTGTWKQTDEVNGDWTWTFDNGKCHLKGDTTGFETDGTYVLDENAKTLTVNMDGWDNEKVYSYTLEGDTLDLTETYSSYHLIKQ